MAYLRPPAFTRHLANPLAMRLSARGVATLTVVGRRTGELHKVPVIPVEVAGNRYLVAPYGESDWVRNLRTAGKGELSRKGANRDLPGYRDPSRRTRDRHRPVPRGRRQLCGPVLHQTARPQGSPGIPSRSGALTRSRPSLGPTSQLSERGELQTGPSSHTEGVTPAKPRGHGRMWFGSR